MSFGYPRRNDEGGYGELEAALERAQYEQVLIFAAASNNGGKTGRSFPAREPTVIAVHATDAKGNGSCFNPTPHDKEWNFATIGEAVESAWPMHLCDSNDKDYVRRMSGTSYATPIMAGISAFLLSYVRIHLPSKFNAIKKQKGLIAVLGRIAEKGHAKERGGYHFVDLSLFNDNLFGKEDDFIRCTIRDILDSS